MEEYIDHFFNVHEFNPTHADHCRREHEETWSFVHMRGSVEIPSRK